MVQSFMLRKQYGEDLILLDLGYYTHPDVDKVGDILRKELGKIHFQIDCDSMLKVEIPRNKLDKLLKKFKQIKKGGRHWKSNYKWEHSDDMPYDVKYHPENVAKYGLPKEERSHPHN